MLTKEERREIKRKLPNKLPFMQWILDPEPSLPDFYGPSLAFDESWSRPAVAPGFLLQAFLRCGHEVGRSVQGIGETDRNQISGLFDEIRRACRFQVLSALEILKADCDFPVVIPFDLPESLEELKADGLATDQGIGQPEVVRAPLMDHFGVDSPIPGQNRLAWIPWVTTVATVYMRVHRLTEFWEAWHLSKAVIPAQDSTSSMSDQEREVADALRDFADELMSGFRSRSSQGPSVTGVRWHHAGVSSASIRNIREALAVDPERRELADSLISTYAINVLPRCHLGLKAAKENDFLGTAVWSVVGEGGPGRGPENARTFVSAMQVMSGIVYSVDKEMLDRLAMRVPEAFVRSYCQRIMIDDPGLHYPSLLEDAIDQGTSKIEPRKKRIYAFVRWVAELLGKAGNPGPLPLDLANEIEAEIDFFRTASRENDWLVLGDRIQECLPSAMYGDMLLWLGIPGFDQVIPAISTIKVEKGVKQQIETAWDYWCAMLHRESADYSPLVTNIAQALEGRLSEVLFFPFERAARDSDWFDPEDVDARKSSVLSELLKRIRNGDEEAVTLGTAAHILKPFREPPRKPLFKESDGMLRKQWRAFVLSRGDRFSPSMIWDLGTYASEFRNPASHYGSTYTRDQAIAARGRAWLLLRNLSTDSPLNRLNLRSSDDLRKIGMPEDEIEMYEVWRGKRR